MKGGGDDETESDFPIQGTRAAKEYHQAVALGTNGFRRIMSSGFNSRGCRNVLRLPTSTGICVRDSDCCIPGIKLMVQQQQLESTSVVGPYKRNLLWRGIQLSLITVVLTLSVDQHCWVTAGPRLRNSESGSHLNSKKEARSGSKNDCMPKSDDKPKVVGRDLDGTIMTLMMMPVSGRRRRTKVARGGIKTPPLRPSGLRSEGELLGPLVFHLRHDSRLQVV